MPRQLVAEGELRALLDEARATFDEAVRAERMRLIEDGHRGSRPHAGLRVWAALGLARVGQPLTDFLPNFLAELPDRIAEAERQAQLKREREERLSTPDRAEPEAEPEPIEDTGVGADLDEAVVEEPGVGAKLDEAPDEEVVEVGT